MYSSFYFFICSTLSRYHSWGPAIRWHNILRIDCLPLSKMYNHPHLQILEKCIWQTDFVKIKMFLWKRLSSTCKLNFSWVDFRILTMSYTHFTVSTVLYVFQCICWFTTLFSKRQELITNSCSRETPQVSLVMKVLPSLWKLLINVFSLVKCEKIILMMCSRLCGKKHCILGEFILPGWEGLTWI